MRIYMNKIAHNQLFHIKKYYRILDYKKENSIRDKIDEILVCELCPNNCTIPVGRTGLCGTRINVDGKFYSTVYGYPCSINLDPIEKKPLYHYLPGEKILSIGTFGCNFFCKGCQNFEITMNRKSFDSSKLKYYSPKDIINIALEHNVKMIAYTYNEPTIFFEYMIDIAKKAKVRGIKNILVSNGYINPKPLKELSKYIDAVNIDLKGIEESFYREYCGVKPNAVLDTIKYMHKLGIWIEITNLIIPGMNDKDKELNKLCKWIVSNIGTNVPLHFSRFFPYHLTSNLKITPEKSLINAKKIALKNGIRFVYVGNLGLIEDTVCYSCDNILINRKNNRSVTDGIIIREYKKVKNFLEKQDLEKNKTQNIFVCSKCGAIIPGVF
jgi:pyruvate formate lyase activating enzyme